MTMNELLKAIGSTRITHRVTAAEATEQSSRGIDPNEVLYQLVAEDILHVLDEFTTLREEKGEPPVVLNPNDIRKIGDKLDLEWWDCVSILIFDAACGRTEKGERT